MRLGPGECSESGAGALTASGGTKSRQRRHEIPAD
jgi:hypothetical protein